MGSYERETFRAAGTASELLQPLLDNQVGRLRCLRFGGDGGLAGLWVTLWSRVVSRQIGYKNMEGVEHLPIPKDKAIGLVKDVFASASERDIYTGDSVDIQIITSKGVEHQTFALRR